MPSHRLPILSCLLLWALLPGHAGAAPKQGKGRSMTQPILFHPAPSADGLKGHPVDILGRIPQGAWMAADRATALELVKRDRSFLALYPSRSAYEEAMAGLASGEVEKAVVHRLALVQGNPQGAALPDFTLPAKASLAAMAALADAGGSQGQAMRAAFARQLTVLRALAGGDDDGGFGAVSLFNGSFDVLNKLNWESESLHRQAGEALGAPEPDVDKSRLELALALELAAQKHGANPGHKPTGRVLDRLDRGILAAPMDAGLVRGIRSSHEPVLEWKDGFVCIWSELQFDQLPMKEKRKTLLYFDGNRCRTDFMLLTEAQLRVRFANREKTSRADDAREYLASLKLDAVLDLDRKAGAAARFDKAISERMLQHARLEAESLRRLLSRFPAWRGKPAAPEAVRKELADALAEIEFWNAWASANQWSLAAPLLEEYRDATRDLGLKPFP